MPLQQDPIIPDPNPGVDSATQAQTVMLIQKAMGDRGWRDRFLSNPIAEAAALVPPIRIHPIQAERIKCIDFNAFFIMRRNVDEIPVKSLARARHDNAQMICAAAYVVRWNAPVGESYGSQEWVQPPYP
ncbi:MAG: hypothetical protein ACT4QA_05985 [Panacagrimonas sp.]